MKHFFLFLLVIVITVFVFQPFVAYAQAGDFCKSGIVPCGRSCNNPATPANETNPCTLCHLVVGFNDLINYGFKILVFVALVCLVIAGIMYILSSGSEEMIKTAKTFLKQILYGFGFVLAAWLLIFVVMNYFGVKSNLGITEAEEGWNKFFCSTQSNTGTSVPGGGGGGNNSLRYTCDRVDVDGNGTIDQGEGACNVVSNGTFSSLIECERNCPVAPSIRCGSNDEGLCTNGLFCPATTIRIDGSCGGNQVCCRPNL